METVTVKVMEMEMSMEKRAVSPHILEISTDKKVAQPHLMKAMAMESMMESAVSQMVQLIEVVLQMATMMVS